MVYRNSLTHDDGDGKDLEAHEVEEALAEEAEDHSDGSDDEDEITNRACLAMPLKWLGN